MASVGPQVPLTVTTTAYDGSDTGSWGLLTNADFSDNAYVQVSLSSGLPTHSDVLQLSNFNFSAIPSGATIDGVVATMERKCGSGAFSERDLLVELMVGGVSGGGSNLANVPAGGWVTSEGTVTYGASNNTWGLALTRTQVVASDFGLRVAVQCDATSKSSAVFQIDLVTMTVYYTAGGGAADSMGFFPFFR